MPGFDFSNYNRNAALHARGVPLPKATSTGTTIVGCIYDGGVVVSTVSFLLKDNLGLPPLSHPRYSYQPVYHRHHRPPPRTNPH